MERFAAAIRAALARRTGLPPEEVRLEEPRNPEHGDLAFPCFPLAKSLRKAPPAIAAELAAGLSGELEGVAARALGPYVNFTVDRAALARDLIAQVEAEGGRYGGSAEGAGRTIVIDLSSPNIAKPMSVGHLRSTVIGAAIQRLHDHLGYRTVGINHIGDWGSQFGKLVAAVERWGGTVDLEADPIRALLALYVRYHEEEERDPSLAERAREAFRELESGEEGSVRATWRRLTELSLREFDKLYRRLGVRFDEIRGEAFYEAWLDATVERIVAAGITSESDGALIVDLSSIDETMPPCLLRKSDGTTLYATRDLAAAFHRWDLYRFERCLYVVGSEQRLHFRQLKAVLRRMGLEWEPRVEHVDFGLLRLPEGKMSTRKGRVVFLEDVLDRAVEEARRIIAEKNPDLPRPDEVAEAVGIGAVVFDDLKRERIKDVEFVLEEILSFEGETGPYVQYTHARLASILRKAAEGGEGGAAPDLAVLAEAGPLLVRLARFGEAVRAAAREAEPSRVAQYLLGLCRDLNTWYVSHRVLGQEPPVTAARLALVRASKTVLANGLRLLGLAAPEEM
jgi:arginyl-tRNA synthetase